MLYLYVLSIEKPLCIHDPGTVSVFLGNRSRDSLTDPSDYADLIVAHMFYREDDVDFVPGDLLEFSIHDIIRKDDLYV